MGHARVLVTLHKRQLIQLGFRCGQLIACIAMSLHQLGRSHMLSRTQDSYFQLLLGSPLEFQQRQDRKTLQTFQQLHAYAKSE